MRTPRSDDPIENGDELRQRPRRFDQDTEIAESADPAALVGQTLGGRYRLLGVIGSGGMGTVFRGEHVIIERPVAVKVLSPQCHRIPQVRERFYREARIATRIRHANVLEVMDLGELEDGRLYLVMELLAGETLWHRISRRESLAEAEARAAAAERTARRELSEWETQLADVCFQIEQLVASSGKTHEPQASDFDGDRREIAALEERRGALWQKLIGLASSLSGARA